MLLMCNRRNFHSTSNIRLTLEENICKHAQQKNQLLTAAADAIRQMAMKNVQGRPLTAREHLDAERLADALDRLA